MHAVRVWVAGWMMLTWLILASGVVAQETEELETKPFTKDQLEQLVAPIALYPDALVAQILMASTYPLQIVQAARWREANPDLEGDALEDLLARAKAVDMDALREEIEREATEERT